MHNTQAMYRVETLLGYIVLLVLRWKFLGSNFQSIVWRLCGPVGTYLILALGLSVVCAYAQVSIVNSITYIALFVIGRVLYKRFVATDYDLAHNSTFRNNAAFVTGATLFFIAIAA